MLGFGVQTKLDYHELHDDGGDRGRLPRAVALEVLLALEAGPGPLRLRQLARLRRAEEPLHRQVTKTICDLTKCRILCYLAIQGRIQGGSTTSRY